MPWGSNFPWILWDTFESPRAQPFGLNRRGNWGQIPIKSVALTTDMPDDNIVYLLSIREFCHA